MKVIKLSAIDSTNSYLKELVRTALLDDEVVVVATKQVNGRGQHGAGWQSEPNKSLTCSLFKRFYGVPISKKITLNFIVSLALLKVLRQHKIPELSIKWPNDIMSRQRKLAGILVENQLKGTKLVSTVIGIGLNVNEEEFDNLPQATSMKLSSGKSFDLTQVLNNLVTTVFNEIGALANQDISEVRRVYESELFRKDVISVFESTHGVQKNGRIIGVTKNGLLKVEHEDNVRVTYDLKEVKLLF